MLGRKKQPSLGGQLVDSHCKGTGDEFPRAGWNENITGSGLTTKPTRSPGLFALGERICQAVRGTKAMAVQHPCTDRSKTWLNVLSMHLYCCVRHHQLVLLYALSFHCFGRRDVHRFKAEASLCSRLNCDRWARVGGGVCGAEEPGKARSASERLILTQLHVQWKIKWLYKPSIITQTSWTEAKNKHSEGLFVSEIKIHLELTSWFTD